LFAKTSNIYPLGDYAESFKGLATGDLARFIFSFWELAAVSNGWRCLQGSVGNSTAYAGKEQIILWENGRGKLFKYVAERLGETGTGAWLRGETAWGHHGVAVAQISSLKATLFSGDLFDESTAAIIPKEPRYLPTLWAYCSSDEFSKEVRKLDHSMKVPTLTLLKVPFDLAHWQRVAAEKYPHGLPKPFSNDPTQWLFDGHPRGSADRERLDAHGRPQRPGFAVHPLQVAAARLLGYRWPRQTGSSFMDCPAITEPDEIDASGLVSDDGIVCLPSLHGEGSAAERLRALLAHVWGQDWADATLRTLFTGEAAQSTDLDTYLADEFFDAHCKLFHQTPFILQIWDGVKGGFSALVNYHRLCAAGGAGRRVLEKLRDTYLGEWIARQRRAMEAGEPGGEERYLAAGHLRGELTKIVEGEPPYDIFVRWKPLYRQPIGWEPDIDDGVRLNLRPFFTAAPRNKPRACILRVRPNLKYGKDRGGEPKRERADFPWFYAGEGDVATVDFAGREQFQGLRFNGFHYTRTCKEAARARHATMHAKEAG
jgi:hypothetical protein